MGKSQLFIKLGVSNAAAVALYEVRKQAR